MYMYYMYGGGKQYLDEISLLFLNLDMVLKISLSSPGEFTLDCKTVRFFAYSSTREQSNKRSGMMLKTESETGERR